MKLVCLLLCAVCVNLTGAADKEVTFEKPRYTVHPWELPDIFAARLKGVPAYPLAIEAVLSVALKLQGIEDHDGKQHNFLVSPLAVAGALGQLMLGAKGDLRRQIGILLTLNREAESGFILRPYSFGLVNCFVNFCEYTVLTNPRRYTRGNDDSMRIYRTWFRPIADNSAVQSHGNSTTLLQRLSNISAPGSPGGNPELNQRISAQTAGAYESQGLQQMPHFAAKGRDGLPGLELHRQLGRLIRNVSSPLPENGNVHSIVNSSYLHTSSAFFLDHNLNVNEPFVRAIIDFYDSKVVPLNFSTNPVGAQNAVNAWGSRETGGLIDHFLLYPPPLDTAVIQAVAVHFRGAWHIPFIPEGTIPGYFKTSANTEVPVKYMRGSFENTYYAENATLGLRLVVLPYSNFECAMYVILPMESNERKFNVGHIITGLNSKDLADFVGSVKKRTVNIMFPKLSLTGSLSLSAALEKHAAFLNRQDQTDKANKFPNRVSVPAPQPNSTSAGTVKPAAPVNASTPAEDPEDNLRVIPLNEQLPVSGSESKKGRARAARGATKNGAGTGVPDLEADDGSAEAFSHPTLTLTGAAADSKFRVSDIIQQIALEINEAGTEAAAIAGSTVNYSGDVKNFKVNRPFLFFIRQEETNAILFWGTIVDPKA